MSFTVLTAGSTVWVQINVVAIVGMSKDGCHAQNIENSDSSLESSHYRKHLDWQMVVNKG